MLELLNAMFPGAFVADARVGYKHEAIGLEATSAADKDTIGVSAAALLAWSSASSVAVGFGSGGGCTGCGLGGCGRPCGWGCD